MLSKLPTQFSGFGVRTKLWHTGLLLVWGLWWGGLSFYAIVVVPIGSELLGTVEQGLVTQRVTSWHDLLTGLVLACLLIEALRSRSRVGGLLFIALAVIAATLAGWHRHLSGLMDFENRSVPAEFYARHAVYLWITAAEWLLGIGLAAWLVTQVRRSASR